MKKRFLLFAFGIATLFMASIKANAESAKPNNDTPQSSCAVTVTEAEASKPEDTYNNSEISETTQQDVDTNLTEQAQNENNAQQTNQKNESLNASISPQNVETTNEKGDVAKSSEQKGTQNSEKKSTNYTVEFTHRDLQYVLKGGTSVKLSEILKKLELSGTPTEAVSSNDELFTAKKQGDEWIIASKKAFNSKEQLCVTIDNTKYNILVTDPTIIHSGSYDDISWTLDDEGTLTISGTGEIKNGSDSGPNWDDIDVDSVYNIVIENGPNSIGFSAFGGFESLESVTIPNSVEIIDSWAFSDCISLSELTIPNSVTEFGESAFQGCISLSNITIPGSVITVGDEAFAYSGIDNVVILSSDTTFGSDVFYVSGENEYDTNIYYYGTEAQLQAACGGAISNTFNSSINPIFHYAIKCGDNVYAMLNEGTLTISGTGEMYDYAANGGNIPWSSERNSITNVIIENGVTKIGQSAFHTCSNLSAITLPNSLETIGAYAFYNCTSLANITIPSSVTSIGIWAFEKSGITSIVIPSGVTEIGERTFNGCTNLREVVIPSSVQTIGYAAFKDCSSLKEIVIPSGVTSIARDAFASTPNNMDVYCQDTESAFAAKCYNGTLTGSFSNAANQTFHYELDGLMQCGDDVYARLSNGTLEIFGSGDMYDYNNDKPWHSVRDSITKVIIKSGVTRIGKDAFGHCNNLESVTIPNTVTSIGASAFAGCNNSLESIIIPDSVTNIERRAFADCKNLKNVTLSNNITAISDYTFERCENLENITLPSGITRIEQYAFYNCTSLESIVIPSSVTVIGDYTFMNCERLKNVSIQNGVITIGQRCFVSCTSLENITIPSSVTTIGELAFAACSSLKEVIIFEANPHVDYRIKRDSFSNTPDGMNVYFYGSKDDFTDSCYLGQISNAFNNEANQIFWFDGTDCSADGSDVWCFNSGDTLTIIGTGAMRNYNNSTTPPPWENKSEIKAVIINDPNVTAIGDYAFYGCDNVEKVVIKNSTATFGQNAFTYIGSGTKANKMNVDYYGTEAQLNTACGGNKGTAFNALSRPVFNFAQKCGENLYYIMLDENNDNTKETVSIFGTGDMYNYSDDNSPWYSNRTDITNIIIENGATSIGNYAFNGCSKLTSIDIPSSITKIGNSAFSFCSGLTNVAIPSGVTIIGNSAFLNCSSLTDITLPEGLTKIDQGAFDGCSELTEILIPNTVTSIGAWTFHNCYNLTSITIPDGITSIGEATFYDCSSLTSINIPESVTSIGESAFESCENLNNVTIPTGVTDIGRRAFIYLSDGADIYYNSSKANFRAINFAISISNSFGCDIGGTDYKFHFRYSITYRSNGYNISDPSWPSTYWCDTRETIKLPMSLKQNGCTLLGWSYSEEPGSIITEFITDEYHRNDLTFDAQWQENPPIKYWENEEKTLAEGSYNFILNPEDNETIDLGRNGTTSWYAVKGAVSCGNIAAHGDVRIVLMDGCDLYTLGDIEAEARSSSDFDRLTIYAQQSDKAYNNNYAPLSINATIDLSIDDPDTPAEHQYTYDSYKDCFTDVETNDVYKYADIDKSYDERTHEFSVYRTYVPESSLKIPWQQDEEDFTDSETGKRYIYKNEYYLEESTDNIYTYYKSSTNNYYYLLAQTIKVPSEVIGNDFTDPDTGESYTYETADEYPVYIKNSTGEYYTYFDSDSEGQYKYYMCQTKPDGPLIAQISYINSSFYDDETEKHYTFHEQNLDSYYVDDESNTKYYIGNTSTTINYNENTNNLSAKFNFDPNARGTLSFTGTIGGKVHGEITIYGGNIIGLDASHIGPTPGPSLGSPSLFVARKTPFIGSRGDYTNEIDGEDDDDAITHGPLSLSPRPRGIKNRGADTLDSPTVNIHGGIISLCGERMDAAAIGGGYEQSGGTVNITGGQIEVIGANSIGAGPDANTDAVDSTAINLSWTNKTDYIYSKMSGFRAAHVNFPSNQFVFPGDEWLESEDVVQESDLIGMTTYDEEEGENVPAHRVNFKLVPYLKDTRYMLNIPPRVVLPFGSNKHLLGAVVLKTPTGSEIVNPYCINVKLIKTDFKRITPESDDKITFDLVEAEAEGSNIIYTDRNIAYDETSNPEYLDFRYNSSDENSQRNYNNFKEIIIDESYIAGMTLDSAQWSTLKPGVYQANVKFEVGLSTGIVDGSGDIEAIASGSSSGGGVVPYNPG